MKMAMKYLSIGMLVVLIIATLALNWFHEMTPLELIDGDLFEGYINSLSLIKYMDFDHILFILSFFISVGCTIALLISCVIFIIGRFNDSKKNSWGLIGTVFMTDFYFIMGSLVMEADFDFGIGLIIAMLMAIGASWTWTIYLKTPDEQPAPYAGGYAPAPGANPYAGGYAPAPEANPYAGGYAPAPEANPYAGGYAPAPEANPYAGGYAPAPEANPYAGGYAPAPEANPYAGGYAPAPEAAAPAYEPLPITPPEYTPGYVQPQEEDDRTVMIRDSAIPTAGAAPAPIYPAAPDYSNPYAGGYPPAPSYPMTPEYPAAPSYPAAPQPPVNREAPQPASRLRSTMRTKPPRG